jgi:ketosteroid isomerase-like protein
MGHGDNGMDDLFAINAAKTEFRECFNLGDVSRLLAIADPDLVSFSDGQPSEFGENGLDALRTRLASLFERFTAKLAVIVIEIRLQRDVAYDYGWHDLTLTPKDGGEPIHRKDRYVDIWRRNKDGNWKLWMYMDNQDVADSFRPEQITSGGAQLHGSF